MKVMRFAVLFTLLALLVAVVPAFAQDGTFGLSPEDFTLFSTANANSAAAESLAYDFTMDLVVSGIEGTEVDASISGTGELSMADGAVMFSMTTTGSATANGEETATDVEIRVIGDMLYINAGEGWQGAKLEDVASVAAGGAGLPVNPEDLMSGDLSGLGPMGGMMGGLATFDGAEYVSIERLDNMDGLAHFSTSLDISGLLMSDEIAGITGMALGGAMGGGEEMPPEQAAQMGQMLGIMFAEAKFTLDQYVNSDSQMIDRTVLAIELPLEQIMGTPGAVVSLNFDISLSNFDAPVSIEVPENVEMMESGM